MRALALLGLVFGLAACDVSVDDTPQRARVVESSGPLPKMRSFDGTQPRVVPLPSRAQLAHDFLELSFQLESGRKLPHLTRFEGPVTISVAQGARATLGPDLDQLLIRLRREAGIDVRRVAAGVPASITIVSLPGDELRRLVPQAACFVAANVSSWAEYLARRGNETDWAKLNTRQKAAVFLPSDSSPQDIRDCLHEEIAQALGPLNDLYRLPWSVFNDDNLQVVLTSYDMAILRLTYAPELRSGMTRDEVAALLPEIIAREVPNAAIEETDLILSDRAFDQALTQAISAAGSRGARIRAASKAVRLVEAAGHKDVRLGMAYLAQATAMAETRPDRALAAFIKAREAFKATYGFESHAAQATLHPAAFAVSNGQYDLAVIIINAVLPAVRRAQNASLLSSLLLVKAEALRGIGDTATADLLRREAKAYALYGFGSEGRVRDRVAQVAALRPAL